MSWLRSLLLDSIRARLLLLLGGLGTLMICLFLLLDYSIDRQIYGRLDAALLGRARGVVVLLERHPRDAAWQELHELSPEYASGGHTDFLQIWDDAGATVFSSASNTAHNLQPLSAAVPANAPLFYDLRLPDGHRGRAVGLRFGMPGRVGDATLVVAEEREQVDQLERRVHWVLISGVLGIGLLAALLAVLAVRGSLRPLLGFAAGTEAGGAPRAEPLLMARMPRELRPFVAALNSAFARLQDALERERRFARDVAHELRTPLAETRMIPDVASWVVPRSEGPRFPGALLIRTRCPDTSDRKSTRLNSSHHSSSYAVFCLKKKKKNY